MPAAVQRYRKADPSDIAVEQRPDHKRNFPFYCEAWKVPYFQIPWNQIGVTRVMSLCRSELKDDRRIDPRPPRKKTEPLA